MMDWSTARPDWATRIAAGQSLLPDGLPIDRARADKALRIFKRLKVYDVPGQPTMAEACPKWVLELVEVIFGCFDPDLRRQLIREFFVCVAKKNTKSTTAAGIMLTALVMHTRHGEEFLILAPTKDVADNSFTPAYHMVKLDEDLLKRFKPSETTRDIINRLDGSTLAVKSADADVIGGQKATSTLVDELWLFGKKVQAKNILSEALGSQAVRPEGFTLYLTTQSDDRPAGVFRDKLAYFRGIRDGKIIDRTKLSLIYEYPEPMQKAEAWRDRRTWHIPNPSPVVDWDWIAGKLAEAENESQDSLQLFCAKHFNVEVGVGSGSDIWPGAQFWQAAAAPTGLTLEDLLARCDVVVVGIDGGGLDDLLGLSVLGRERETRRWLSWSRAWAHECVLKRRASIATRLQDFKAEGTLFIIPDESSEDIQAVADIIEKIESAGLLPQERAVGVDPAGIADIVDELVRRGFSVETAEQRGRIAGVKQGYATLNNTTKVAERRVAAKTMLHDGSALMAWCVANAKVVPHGNSVVVEKAASGTAKIDPLMAMFSCVALMAENPEATGKSIYTDSGQRPEGFVVI